MKIIIPDEVQIGCHTWAVKFKERDNTEGFYGLCQSDTQTITLRAGMVPSMALETFVHEVLHALDFTYNGLSLGETKVHNLAVYLTAFLMENGFLTNGQSRSITKNKRRKTSTPKRKVKGKKVRRKTGKVCRLSKGITT